MTGSNTLVFPAVAHNRGFWAGLFTLSGSGSISFHRGRWVVTTSAGLEEFGSDEVESILVQGGFFWSSLTLRTSGRWVCFAGLPSAAARELQNASRLWEVPERVDGALRALRVLLERKRYLNHFAWSGWRADAQQLRGQLDGLSGLQMPKSIRERCAEFVSLYDGLEGRVEQYNQALVDREVKASAALFNEVTSSRLTVRQREAVVTNEDNTLVVAGAGTGKTTVVVAKVVYLVKRLAVPPQEILLLAYNRAAMKEMRERLVALGIEEVEVSTFHALGLRLLAEATGRKPSVSVLATDDHERKLFIEGVLRGLIEDPKTRPALIRYFVEHLRPYKSPFEFETAGEYYGWLKDQNIRTLKNEQVKSYEESVIANWLFLNGIDYRYEAAYEQDTTSRGKRQYKPDFKLTGLPESAGSVYIEHWGIGRDGNTASYVSQGEYRARMKWARDIHLRHQTTLVETFSYDRQEGKLIERLEERLAELGIRPKPRSAEEICTIMVKRREISALASLLANFQRHFKSGDHQIPALRRSSRGGDETRRAAFLDVFERVHRAYQQRLEKDREIDFEDMIAAAAGLVEKGRAPSLWRYVIVDEFQDISRDRARLLQAMLDKVEDRRLTCVGDDWQSIYRFAGSDIRLMTNFPEHFGYTASVSLDKTFRFGKRLVKATSTFVQQNDAQLVKELTAECTESNAPIVVIPLGSSAKTGSSDREALQVERVREVLQRIHDDSPQEPKIEVLLLGRYKHDAPAASNSELTRGFPRLRLSFSTVHAAKGKEADYVVVMKVGSGRHGFPTGVVDDPLLDMVLSDADEIPYAEERRLFYVALTRSKSKVFLLTPDAMRSPFIDELSTPAYKSLVELPERWLRSVPCPACGASLTLRTNQKTGAPFWGCVHYPYCSGVMDVCAECQEGALILEGTLFQCSNTVCDNSAEACPRCEKGMLRRRKNGQTGSPFWGCSEWKHDRSGCSFTRSA